MKAGILGSRVVGTTLADGFLKHGHRVMIGSRSPEKLKEWKEKSGGMTGSFSEAAEFGEIIILAVKGGAALQALELAGKENFSGKTVIDTTNPIADAPPANGVLSFFTDLDYSLMETFQETFPEAKFVKAFSCVGNALMVNPDFGGVKPTMFIAGNDTQSKQRGLSNRSVFSGAFRVLSIINGCMLLNSLRNKPAPATVHILPENGNIVNLLPDLLFFERRHLFRRNCRLCSVGESQNISEPGNFFPDLKYFCFPR